MYHPVRRTARMQMHKASSKGILAGLFPRWPLIEPEAWLALARLRTKTIIVRHLQGHSSSALLFPGDSEKSIFPKRRKGSDRRIEPIQHRALFLTTAHQHAGGAAVAVSPLTTRKSISIGQARAEIRIILIDWLQPGTTVREREPADLNRHGPSVANESKLDIDLVPGEPGKIKHKTARRRLDGRVLSRSGYYEPGSFDSADKQHELAILRIPRQ